MQVLYILVCIRSVLKDDNSTDQMLKYTSFYAVKGQYTQQGCKQDRFCTIQPFALQILVLCHLFCHTFTVLSFLELKGHLEKNFLSHAISALFRQRVFISGQQTLLFYSMPSCVSGVLTMCPMPVVP